MPLSRYFQTLFRSSNSAKSRSRLGLESLEDRAVPVVGATVFPLPVAAGTGFDGVVRIGNASGTLLRGGRHVLSAAHIVTNGQGQIDVPNVNITFQLPGKTINIPVNQANYSFPSGFNGNINLGHDIVIFELPALAPSGPQGMGAERYDIYRQFDEIGQTYQVVGYGRTGTGLTGELANTGGTKRAGLNTFGADSTGFNTLGQRGLTADFDNGAQANNTLGESLGLGLLEVATGAGDSGGPAFLNGRIAGVNSRTPPGGDGLQNNFGDVDIFTRMSTYATFVDGLLDAPHELVLDMNFQKHGNDTNGDTIVLRRTGFLIEIEVNNQLVHSVAVNKVTGVRLLGSNDFEEFVVRGDLGRPVFVDGRSGSDTVIVEGTNLNDRMTLSGATVTADTPNVPDTVVSFVNTEAVTLRGLDGQDRFVIQGAVPTYDLTINGGAGIDTIERSGTGFTQWNITGTNAGNLNQQAYFLLVENLLGSDNADAFRFSDGAGVSGYLAGQGGTDRLDYSAYTTAVKVNTSTGEATNVGSGAFSINEVFGGTAGDWLTGGVGNDYLRGGGGNDLIEGGGGADLIMGDAGNDILRGGTGRDLLIGGSGGDFLYGEGGEDILIGGTTSYDNFAAVLLGLRQLWTGAGTYPERIDLLRNQGHAGVFRLDATSVQDDGDVDQH